MECSWGWLAVARTDDPWSQLHSEADLSNHYLKSLQLREAGHNSLHPASHPQEDGNTQGNLRVHLSWGSLISGSPRLTTKCRRVVLYQCWPCMKWQPWAPQVTLKGSPHNPESFPLTVEDPLSPWRRPSHTNGSPTHPGGRIHIPHASTPGPLLSWPTSLPPSCLLIREEGRSQTEKSPKQSPQSFSLVSCQRHLMAHSKLLPATLPTLVATANSYKPGLSALQNLGGSVIWCLPAAH